MSETFTGQLPGGLVPTDAAAADDAPVGERAQAPGQPGGPELPATGDVVLDASFVIALLQRDPAASALAHVLPRGVMTSVTAGEVYAALGCTAGADPRRIEGVLRALGVRIVDLPLAAAHHFPRLRRLDAARLTERQAGGEQAVSLSLAELCVLGYAAATKATVLTRNQHWGTLIAPGLCVPVYVY